MSQALLAIIVSLGCSLDQAAGAASAPKLRAVDCDIRAAPALIARATLRTFVGPMGPSPGAGGGIAAAAAAEAAGATAAAGVRPRRAAMVVGAAVCVVAARVAGT